MTRGPLSPGETDKRSVALCVAAYNAETTLTRCLDSLLEQSPGQVLVVNDGSTDATPDILMSYDRIRTIHLPENRGVGHARNVALATVGEQFRFVGFVDSDIVLAENWLDTLLSSVDWETYAVACGLVVPAKAGVHWAATLDETETLNKFGLRPRPLDPPWREVMYFNHLFRTEVFRKVGKFDPLFRTNAEDSDFFFRCEKQGIRFFYHPGARALHCYPLPTLGTWLKRSYRNGFYTVRFHRKNRTPILLTKKLKVSLAVCLLLAASIEAIVRGSFWLPVGLLGVGGGIGLAKSFRIDWRPPLGGWIGLARETAKTLGEIRGFLSRCPESQTGFDEKEAAEYPGTADREPDEKGRSE